MGFAVRVQGGSELRVWGSELRAQGPTYVLDLLALSREQGTRYLSSPHKYFYTL